MKIGVGGERLFRVLAFDEERDRLRVLALEQGELGAHRVQGLEILDEGNPP